MQEGLLASGLLVAGGVLLWALKARRPVMLLAVFLQLRYLHWRAVQTLELGTLQGVLVTGGLFLAELYGLLQNFFFVFQTWRPLRRSPPPLKDYPTVDIFVPVVDEPLEILERTLVGALAQDYPRGRFQVHVLDDAGRAEVRALAQSLGCHWHHRPQRRHGKAGNLNYALQRTRGELVAVLDVDHVPVRTFLRDLVGFFQEPRVAFVQSPHHFYNPDIFQKTFLLQREISNEQDLFFRAIQPGRDATGSAFFAGSGGLLRRAALQELGGFSAQTLTEDLHTSLELCARGWRSCYLDRVLSAGLAPEDLKGYLRQRQRWAKGAVQTLKVANPLFKRGLSWAQRLNYFASIYYFFHGLPRVVYLAAPLAFLLLGVPPLRAQPLELAHYFLSYYVVAQLMMYVVAPGLRRAFWSDIYETVMSFPLSHAVLGGLLGRRREAVFQVTPKGRRQGQLELQLRLLWPHVLLLCALLAGLLKAHLWDAHDGGALLISTVWAVFNSLLLLVAVALTLQRPQRRRLLRLRRRIACSLKGRAELAQGYTLDISEEGASVCLQTLGFFFKHPEVELTLRASYGESTTVKARLLRQEPTREGMVLALKFTPYETQTKHALLRQMFSPPESWAQDEPPGASAPLLDILLPLKGLLRAFRGGRTLQRLYPRVELRSPCSLRLRDGAMLQCMSRDVSYSGLSVLLEKMPHGLPDAREVLVELPREGVKLKAQVVAVQDATVHLRVKEICSGGERWEELCRPSV